MRRFSFYKTDPRKTYFSLPSDLFENHLSCGEAAIYAYLCYLKQQRPDISAPTLGSIGSAVGIKTNATVKKYLELLDEKYLVQVCPQEILSTFAIPLGTVLYFFPRFKMLTVQRREELESYRRDPKAADYYAWVRKPYRSTKRMGSWKMTLEQYLPAASSDAASEDRSQGWDALIKAIRQKFRPSRNFFPVPNSLFSLGLGHQEIAIYCYLLQHEKRRVYTCYPSFRTIGRSLNISRTTVMNHVRTLEEKCLITTKKRFRDTDDGRVLNASLSYTILPFNVAVDYYNEVQMYRCWQENERVRVQKLLAKQREEREARLAAAGERQDTG